MKKNFKLVKYFLIFIIIVISLIALMILSAKIPKKMIENNVIESAEYFNEKELFYEMIDNHNETKIDHYADSITLNITYNIESKNSFRSVLKSNYYGNNKKSEIDNLLKTSTNNTKYKATTEYIRYWHGTVPILRVLLIFFNIKQIYILNAILLSLLISYLIYKLIKNKLYLFLIGFIISLILTNSFVVPFCLEYSNMYFVTLIGTIILLNLLEKKKDNLIFILFFILGIITCFIDFLTTETMSLLVPLILLLVYKYKDEKNINIKEIALLTFKTIIVWLIGYVIMWITKWGISLLVLNIDLKEVVLKSVEERLGAAKVLEIGTYTKSVVLRNVFCLFPLCYINNKLLILLLFLFILYTFLFFVRKNKNTLSWLLFLIALIPYIRFIVVNNHSYLHYFFTYRAQISSIIAIVLGSYYMIDKNIFGGIKKCLKKKK